MESFLQASFQSSDLQNIIGINADPMISVLHHLIKYIILIAYLYQKDTWNIGMLWGFLGINCRKPSGSRLATVNAILRQDQDGFHQYHIT